MKKSLIFVTSSLLSIGLLAGCGTNDDNNNGKNDTTGVKFNNRGVNTENVRYNWNDRLGPDDVRYDYQNNNNGIFDNNRNVNNGFGTYNNNYRNGDSDLVDVDYDNAEPDPGEEPNEDRHPFIKGHNDDNDGLFNNNRGINGNGNGVDGNIRTGTPR
ncbi:MAG TPA: hypothetical protein GXX18_13230 [Bacillales bacterium]|nr:hypothetical protein [Bacillales bacterium]